MKMRSGLGDFRMDTVKLTMPYDGIVLGGTTGEPR
jgi:hypothetical protein